LTRPYLEVPIQHTIEEVQSSIFVAASLDHVSSKLIEVTLYCVVDWLWQAMANEYMKDKAPALCNVVSRHLQEAEQARQQGMIHW